jgi:hypothetical protein
VEEGEDLCEEEAMDTTEEAPPPPPPPVDTHQLVPLADTEGVAAG